MQKLLETINMKKILIIFLLATLVSFAQETVIDIDYTVDYVVPNKRKKTVDTISIGFNKDGKYLWTNSNILTSEFGNSVFLGGAKNIDDAQFNLIYSVENGTFIILFKYGESVIYANLDIETIIPMDEEDSFDENMNLVAEQINEKERVLDFDCSSYKLYPDSKPNEAITISVADDLESKNNVFFSKFINLMLRMTSSKGQINVDLPDGLILKVLDDEGSVLIEAINVENNKKTITINHSFKITE